MSKKFEKAYEISDAKIQFVSLVNKAANKRQFLITKGDDGTVNFTSQGKILKADTETHYITGVVYEPMVEDAHGNYMSADEIKKAAYNYTKEGSKIDIQHSFEQVSKADVVESYIAPCDMTVNEEVVKAGTWLMTVEVTDTEIWEKVEKGEITGFSMGGIGIYSDEDVNLEEIEKKTKPSHKKGLFKQLAAVFGYELVEKGEYTDAYMERAKSNNFWNAFYTLEDLLYGYNWNTDNYMYEEDEDVIRNVLSEFNETIVELLTQKSIKKSLIKTGKERKKEIDMKEEDVKKMLETAIAKSLEPINEKLDQISKGNDEPDPAPEPALEPPNTEEDTIEKMINESITNAVEPITKALDTLMASRGLPNNLNNEPGPVKKEEQHYMAGMF